MSRLVFIIVYFFSVFAHANVISHSGQEVSYQYQAEFRSLIKINNRDTADAKIAAEFHAAHLFGFFNDNEYAAKYTPTYYLNAGFAGNKFTLVEEAQFFVKAKDPYLWVKYSARGQMMVLSAVLKKWLNGKNQTQISLPLLQDLPAIYKWEDNELSFTLKKWEKCTDAYYKTAADFSYFYTAFYCEELSTAPIAKNVSFKITPLASTDRNLPLQKLLGPNGNGKLTTAYFVFGFDKTPPFGAAPEEIQKDSGWVLYKNFENKLVNDYNFTKVLSLAHYRELVGAEQSQLELLMPVTLEHNKQRRYTSTYVRKESGRTWVVRSALFDSTHDNLNVSFPKFWKEAWENGDFIYYGGHSGDGSSLNFGYMLEAIKRNGGLANIGFKHNKTQLAFLDSCSGYAHYLDMYVERKPKNLHLLNYALVSLFETAEHTLAAWLDIIFKAPNNQNLSWLSVLKTLEAAQLEPALDLWYGENSRQLIKYRKKGFAPSYLMNVYAP